MMWLLNERQQKYNKIIELEKLTLRFWALEWWRCQIFFVDLGSKQATPFNLGGVITISPDLPLSLYVYKISIVPVKWRRLCGIYPFALPSLISNEFLILSTQKNVSQSFRGKSVRTSTIISHAHSLPTFEFWCSKGEMIPFDMYKIRVCKCEQGSQPHTKQFTNAISHLT